MQRLPNHMRDMLSTRNPSDNWVKTMCSGDNFQIHSTTGPMVTLDTDVLQTILSLAKEGLENAAIGSNNQLLEVEEQAMRAIHELRRYYPQLVD